MKKENEGSESKMSKEEMIESLLDLNYADPRTAPIEDCCGASCCGCQD